jgi:membrane-associated protease RseP (regulator of RpoE activity)
MGFLLYDIIFLLVFAILFAVFIWRKKHNLKRQGILFLYPTQVGVKFIDSFTKKYSKLLKVLEIPVIISGFALMVAMIWMLISFSYSYLSSPFLAQALKIPVLMPLVPYLPALFKISFLPPFYFTYWILIIAIIAIPHEFAHGIYARLHKIKVHSTGFGFLGPFLAAFVEPDERKMQRAPIKAQMSVLAAGTFTNVLVAIFSTLLLWIFFAAAFAPAGINFNTYSLSIVNISDINAIGGTQIGNSTEVVATTNSSLINVTANNETYFTDLQTLTYFLSQNSSYIVVYDNSPAFNANLPGTILAVDNKPIKSYQELNKTMLLHKPGDNVTITTRDDNNTVSNTQLTLGDKGGKAFLGIGVIPAKRSGLMGWFYSVITKVKDPSTAYDSRIGDFGVFVYDLLWWSAIISISVALVNMLPVGIFDGGRFFYLAVLAVTKKEKIAKNAFKTSTWIMLALVALLMLKWVFAFI